MNVEELKAARANGLRPEAPRANLRDANLRDANLRDANLRDANLRDANLRYANLRYANLWDADLSGANLWDADLSGANLWDANLSGANLWGGFQHTGLSSGQAVGFPTADGWVLQLGCWSGTTDELRTLVAGTDWPSNSLTEERDRRRPGLLLLADLFDAHCVYHQGKLDAVVERWGTVTEEVK